MFPLSAHPRKRLLAMAPPSRRRLAPAAIVVIVILLVPAWDTTTSSCGPVAAPVAMLATKPTSRMRTVDGKLFGVSIAGAEFTEGRLPGTLGVDYVYPDDSARFRYFHEHGLTLVRLPFRWERVQPEAFGELSREDVAGIRAVLNAAEANGEQVILDLHNYGRYDGRPLSRDDAARFADVWRRLAEAVQGYPALFGYELMNEPHDLPGGSETWAYLAQVATDAIRTRDRTSWVLVPGYGWQSAQAWPQNNRTLDVHDASDRLMYAAHEYFDRDGSGTYTRSYDADGAYPCVGVDRLRPFLDWLRLRNQRGIVTEYGVPDNDPRWLDVLARFLATLNAAPRLAGGTYWPAGPWWGDYPLSVEPVHGQDRPQAKVIFQYPSQP